MKLTTSTQISIWTTIGACMALFVWLPPWAHAGQTCAATPSAAAYSEEVQAGMSAIVPLLPEYVTIAERKIRSTGMVAGKSAVASTTIGSRHRSGTTVQTVVTIGVEWKIKWRGGRTQ